MATLPRSVLIACLLSLPALRLLGAETPLSGQQIYQQQCIQCHGAQGEGVPDSGASPLRGGRSLDELATLIEETMPEDDPEACTGDAAKAAAQYILDTFYREAADDAAPRIEVTRLTVRQHAHALTDLLATFLGEAERAEQFGLAGRYYNERGFRRDKLILERTDPRVDFAFGDKSPEPEKIGAEEFSIQWQGGVLAEETGDYEFILKTDNGARLWVNDLGKPLIDAWVKSGDDTEHRESIRLLGGRVYALKLDFVKSKDSKTSSIALQWQPPRRAAQVIPERNLVRGRFPYSFVLATPFPADDSSQGYERGVSVSPEWDRAATQAALEVASFVGGRLEDLAGVRENSSDRVERLQDFCARFAERAFRRPLTADERAFYIDRRFEGQNSDSALKAAILLVLKSPRFLYLELQRGRPDDYDVATRLSFGLWDSLPDKTLLEAAARGELRTEEQVAAQARRMVEDPRAWSKLRAFLHQWLHVERIADLSKDPSSYPDFDAQVVTDLQASLDLFLEEAAWGAQSDFRQLLVANHVYLNDRLARFYGQEAPEDGRFHKIAFPAEERAGLLTHPALLTGFAYHKASSPIHRGVFVVRSLLGRPLKAPPAAVAPLDEGVDPDMTTRERVAFQTSPAACATCHTLINPLGFGLEQYDAVGRFRHEEKGKPIDASGSLTMPSGEEFQFQGGRPLAELLADSGEVHATFVRQLFHYMMKQPVTAYGPDQVEHLVRHFTENGFSVPKLLIEIMRSAALVANSREDHT